MLDIPQARERSGYTDEQLFDWGISGVLRFLVVVPELGACAVPDVALSHFMAGALAYDAVGLIEHYSGAKSGAWTIQRANLRILADSWQELERQSQELVDAAQRATASDIEAEALWHDVNLDAGYWFNLHAVTPSEAAVLLSCQNPHDASAAEKARQCTVQDGSGTFGPEDFKRLERAFIDLAARDVGPVNLRAWRERARAQGLRYHTWLDRYLSWADGKELSSRPFSGPTFELPAQPTEVPERLAKMAPDEQVQLQWNHAGARGASVGRVADAIEAWQTVIDRQRLRRFTMREAAEVMAQAHGLDASDFLHSRMLPAFHAGLLKLIDPKDGGPVSGRSPRDFNDWVTPEHLNAWLENAGFLHRWPEQSEPVEDKASPTSDGVNYRLLATPEQLVEAFGRFTGLTADWLKPSALRETPALSAARKVAGQGGRKAVQPLFCPFEVTQWLVSTSRRKGRHLSAYTGWRIFEEHFPDAYSAHRSKVPDMQ